MQGGGGKAAFSSFIDMGLLVKIRLFLNVPICEAHEKVYEAMREEAAREILRWSGEFCLWTRDRVWSRHN